MKNKIEGARENGLEAVVIPIEVPDDDEDHAELGAKRITMPAEAELTAGSSNTACQLAGIGGGAIGRSGVYAGVSRYDGGYGPDLISFSSQRLVMWTHLESPPKKKLKEGCVDAKGSPLPDDTKPEADKALPKVDITHVSTLGEALVHALKTDVDYEKEEKCE